MLHPVYLVGAGPGDPELLTLKAVRVLAAADVVLVDDLVNPAILAHCPLAHTVHIGKRGGCRSTPQAFIQRLMLRYVRQGKKVVRLKGGDPCIFGRAGEEAQWLRAHGLSCEVVNGITAGLAAANACQIPLTMRGLTHGVTLVTAHTEDGLGPHWPALVAGGTTLVIYMSVSTLASTQQQLLAHGMPAEMPVVFVENASLRKQRCLSTSLARAVCDAAAWGLQSPAIIVVGKVAALAAVNLQGVDFRVSAAGAQAKHA